MDPRTGRPVQGMLSVAVLASTGTAGDALDNAFFVMGPERSRAYLKTLPDTEVFFLPDARTQRALPDLEATPFAPKTYVAYRAPAKLNMDGKLDEAAWASAAWTDAFVDIEGDARPRPRFRTRAKMLWDDEYFYVAAEMEEPDVWGTLTERDAVIFRDNDFEIFIDPDGDTHAYAELEVNALGTPWDLLLDQAVPRRRSGDPRVGHRRPAGRRRRARHAQSTRATATTGGRWRSRCRGRSCARRRADRSRRSPAIAGASTSRACNGRWT